jgi:hypothetical protein
MATGVYWVLRKLLFQDFPINQVLSIQILNSPQILSTQILDI